MFGLCVHNICYCRGNPISLDEEAFVKLNSIYEWKMCLLTDSNHLIDPYSIQSTWCAWHFWIRLSHSRDLCGNFVISFLYISFDIFSGSKNGKMWKFDDHQRSCCCCCWGLGMLFIVKQPFAERTGSDNIEMEIKFSCVFLLAFLL